MWYSYDKVMTYDAMLNFILGERGVGKSYGLKKYLVKRYKKRKRQFIYLRRYDTELKKNLKGDEFFKDIRSDEAFKNDKLEVRGDKFYCNNEICGYAIPLTKATIYKSVPFPYVDFIMFDEFLIEEGTYHYLKEEPEKLLDFMETVGRLRNIKCFCLGNSTSIVNPYFDYFNISLPYNADIKTFKEGLILINYIKNEVYREEKHKSKFGRLIEGTRYSSYAIDNKFLLDNNNFIKKKTTKSKFFYTLQINKHKFGVWNDYETGEMFITRQLNETNPIVIAFNYNDHNEETVLQKTSSVFFQNLLRHYELSKLFFENQLIKSEVMKIVTKTKW